MANVTEIWNARNARGGRRHWVRFAEEMMISGEEDETLGVLSIARHARNGQLNATLRVDPNELSEEISRGDELVIRIHELELRVIVRAVEDNRALIEFAVPKGYHAQIALDTDWGERFVVRPMEDTKLRV